ncbi:MAG: hypothetical protein HYV75_06990 [Opitutae bacterium]|nr:hypothetical protein [Opitutae bacterium]
MKNHPISSLIRCVGLMLCLVFVSSELKAYSPPLAISGPTLTVFGTTHFYTFSVYDPIAGATRYWQSDIILGSPSASNAYISGNVAVVIFKTSSQNELEVSTYDPSVGAWRGFSYFATSWGNLVSLVASADGVIAWEEYNSSSSFGWNVFAVTYDPNGYYPGSHGTWIQTSFAGLPSGVRTYTIDHGVVGWRVSYNSLNSHEVGYGIYDPASGSWKTQTSPCFSGYFGMNNGSVTFDSSITGSRVTKGYDPYTSGGVWSTGNTKSLAYFRYQNIGSDVILTDMSIGGLSWDWDFGDGNTSSSRSVLHAYSITPPLTINLDITTMDSVPRNSNLTVFSF